MIINRETAMLLWSKSFGKTCKVKDFAGREMIKAAYNDRGSKYGWNVDHILPQSKNGKTTESNLICCHILTNDEKADKFPCFSANGKKFEILKVQNHYEIKSKAETPKENPPTEKNATNEINFFDSAAGIRFFKQLKGIQNKPIFVGTVIIHLFEIHTSAVIDFINEIFSDKAITYERNNYAVLTVRGCSDLTITIKDHDIPQKEDIADLLDRCILLNTYLGYYFQNNDIIGKYQIFYGVHTREEKMQTLSLKNDLAINVSSSLLINELVKINTEANEKLSSERAIARDKLNYNVYKYEYIYTQLAENLKKQTK